MKTDWLCDSHDNRKKNIFILTLTTHEKMEQFMHIK